MRISGCFGLMSGVTDAFVVYMYGVDHIRMDGEVEGKCVLPCGMLCRSISSQVNSIAHALAAPVQCCATIPYLLCSFGNRHHGREGPYNILRQSPHAPSLLKCLAFGSNRVYGRIRPPRLVAQRHTPLQRDRTAESPYSMCLFAQTHLIANRWTTIWLSPLKNQDSRISHTVTGLFAPAPVIANWWTLILLNPP